jgi:hypothetical protein
MPDEAQRILGTAPNAVAMLGEIIRRHGLGNDVSVALLHRHYSILPSEKIVLRRDGSELIIEPCQNTDIKCVPFLWKLEASPNASWLPLEFIEESKDSRVIKRRADYVMQSTAFLGEVAHTLRKLKIADVLGIAVSLEGMITLKEGEVLSEETDEVRRISSLKPFHAGSLADSHTVETLWSVASVNPQPVAIYPHCRA